jgi:hypothetical protein
MINVTIPKYDKVIEDLHEVRRKHYEKCKNMTNEERNAEISEGARRVWQRYYEILREKELENGEKDKK